MRTKRNIVNETLILILLMTATSQSLLLLPSNIREKEEGSLTAFAEEPPEVTMHMNSQPYKVDIAVAPAVEETVVIEERYVPPAVDVNAIARTIYGEGRGISSDMEKSAIAWIILNRYDAGFADSVLGVITAPHQFVGYNPNHPLEDNMVSLATDVLIRHHRETNGEKNVGRIIPTTYLYFHGDGRRNHFRKEYRSRDYWDWSLDNPYET